MPTNGSTRAAVFEAAAAAAAKRVPTVVTGALTERDDLERAFSDWQNAGGTRVALRLTTTASGDVAAEFKPATWYDVLLDGAAHGCELPDDDAPEAGQERLLGDVLAHVDDVTTGEGSKPLILASRL